MRKVYADHAATTRVHPAVAAEMARFLTEEFGNPSSIHAFGRAARKGLEQARQRVASLIGARPAEIFFTSGGTEADNWALRGTAYAGRARGNHIITTAVEHHAVLDCCQTLEKEGFAVTYLPVEPGTGLVRPEDLLAALRPETILVSIMYANNEVGTVMPVAELCRLVKERDSRIVFHTDAVQAAGIMPLDVAGLGVDLMTLSAHKIYGPKGVGALYLRKGFRFQPTLFGGGQERKMRPGTENAPGIVGFGQAAELALREREERAAHARILRDRFLRGVRERVAGVRVNGPDPLTDGGRRHPGNANLTFDYVEGEALLLRLDMKGIACSSGSACTSGSLEPSHVILAIGVPPEAASGSVRFSFGAENTEADIDYLLDVLPEQVEALRRISPLYPGRN